MTVLLTVAYDGTAYCGFQRQTNGITVQEKLEDALSCLFSSKINVAGASRTDAGVHALGQRITFIIEPMKIPLDRLPYAINANLPDDITVHMAEKVSDGFNPRHAKDKTYIYQIYNSRFPNPTLRNYTWFVPYKLDINDMRKAAEAFVGSHDFKAFCATGSSVKTTVRTIYQCNIVRDEDLISLSIKGNGFLYNMVRIITGTIMYVGHGKIPAESIPDIILSRDRTQAGKTAPPQGLFLRDIKY